jgi:hypothetical protein
MLEAFGPEAVVPAMLVLAAGRRPTRTTLCAGAGGFEAAHVTLTQGAFVGIGRMRRSGCRSAWTRCATAAAKRCRPAARDQGANEMRLARQRR